MCVDSAVGVLFNVMLLFANKLAIKLLMYYELGRDQLAYSVINSNLCASMTNIIQCMHKIEHHFIMYKQVSNIA